MATDAQAAPASASAGNLTAGIRELLARSDEYQKDLLRRLGVQGNLDDREEFFLQSWAAARHAGFSDKEFQALSPRELFAVLELKARALPPRERFAGDPVPDTKPQWVGPTADLRHQDPLRTDAARVKNPPKRNVNVVDKGDLKILQGTDGKRKNAVTLDVAGRFGGVSKRAIEKAVKKGSLHAIGERQNRRISVESLLKYFFPENNAY